MRTTFIALLSLTAALSFASPIEYHFSGLADGIIGGETFHSLVHITAVSDTTNVTSDSGIYKSMISNATIQIGGIGTTHFSESVSVFDNNNFGVVGLTANSNGNLFHDIIQVHGSTIGTDFFNTYDLKSATGPWNGGVNPSTENWYDVNTGFGPLTIRSMTDTTFEAKVAAVPEPASVAVLATGILGVMRRRRSK